ncbi:hypothetical protein ABW21_db0201542 [Orbilia brochopaga]|nr:hypothetical protein ABW21_db0201542 [Drechslerella brochopaga]
MALRLAMVVATLSATVLSAALPANKDNKDGSLEKRDHVKYLEIWTNGGSELDIPEDYSREADDAWQKLELDFPIQMFDKINTTAWISMNGAFCLDDPTELGPSVPATSLPVDATKCNGKGCLPNTCILPLWDDYYLPRKSKQPISVSLTYHFPSDAPQVGYHYHIWWLVCRKSGQATNATTYEDCGDKGYHIQVNFYQNIPGKYFVFHYAKPDSPNIVGAQSFPKFIQAPSEQKFRCAVIDTINEKIQTSDSGEDCHAD